MYFVFRIQNTSEPVVPLSEHMLVIAERDAALRERDDARKEVADARIRINELEAEIRRLKNNDLDRYLASADRDRKKILESLQSIMKESKIKIQIIPDQGILRLPESVLFKKGSSTIESLDTVRAIAGALAEVLPCFSLGQASHPNRVCNPNATFIDAVLIERHTDNVQIKPRTRVAAACPSPNGGFGNPVVTVQATPVASDAECPIKDNLDLSARRATTTVRAIYSSRRELLDMYSISPSREDKQLGQGHSPLVNAAAFGETRPAFPNDNEEGRARNRRVDLRVLLYTPRSENLDVIRKLLGP
jgi:flagellar motor protein MotB